MFYQEIFKEVFLSIQKNSTRTMLSGFTISLGIFVFIVLFGLGNGLSNGFDQKYKTKVSNLITIKSGKVSKPYAGNQSDREIQLKNQDYQELVKTNQNKIDQSSVVVSREVLARNQSNSGKYKLFGIQKSFVNLTDFNINKGRFFSLTDENSTQKSVVIGRLVEQDLFENQTSLGKQININGLNYRVVGVFSQEGNEIEERKIFTLYKTFASVFSIDNAIESIVLTNEKKMSITEAIGLGHKLNNQLKEKFKVDSTDQSAIQMNNKTEESRDTDNFIYVLNFVVLLIGSGTLIAGAIGISNIMLYIIRERNFEIGIRKALGAKPKDIVVLIMSETLFIMLIFGFLGSGAAILLLTLIGEGLNEIFIVNPQVKMPQVLFSFFTLILFGLIAGYIPARIASKIKPVNTIRKNH
jgi:putative ABC transport system permease protein